MKKGKNSNCSIFKTMNSYIIELLCEWILKYIFWGKCKCLAIDVGYTLKNFKRKSSYWIFTKHQLNCLGIRYLSNMHVQDNFFHHIQPWRSSSQLNCRYSQVQYDFEWLITLNKKKIPLYTWYITYLSLNVTGSFSSKRARSTASRWIYFSVEPLKKVHNNRNSQTDNIDNSFLNLYFK